MSRFTFSSKQLPANLSPAARARAWAESLMEGGYNGEATVPDCDGFYAATELVAPPQQMISRAHATSLILKRDMRHIVGDNDDRLTLFFNIGQSNMRTVQLGRDIVLKANEGVFLTQDHPQILDGSYSGEVITLILPKSHFESWATPVHDKVGYRHDFTSPVYRLLLGYSRMLSDEAEHLGADQVQSVSRHICELTAMWVGAVETETREDAHQAQYLAIRRIVRRHLALPTLTLPLTARLLNLSERQVQHILQIQGTHFSRLVSETRCERAHALLQDPACLSLSAHTIAALCGFQDYVVFYRAYKRHYEQTPGDTRSLSRATRMT